MALSLGDVTLYFRAETSDLHGAIHEIGTRLPAELEKSNKTIKDLNDNLDATGDNIAYAGEAARKSGSDIEDAGHRAETAFHRASGELELFGEITGVRLPRHVRSFIASLPGVTTALSAAFSATAIFFAIEALVKLAEKLKEIREQPEKIAAAWRDMGDVNVKVARDMATRLADIAASAKDATEETKLYAATLRNMSADANLAASAVKQIGDQLLRNLNLQLVSRLNPFSWWNANSRKDAEEADKFLKEVTSSVERLGAVGGRNMLELEIRRLDTAIAAETETLRKNNQVRQEASGIEVIANALAQQNSENRLNSLKQQQQEYRNLKDRLVDVMEIHKASDQRVKDDQSIALRAKQYDTLTAAAKSAMESQLSDIANILAKEHLAYETRGIDAAAWAVAQRTAADAATEAQENYARKLNEIAQRFGTRDQAAVASAALAKKLADDQTKWMEDEAKQMEVLNQKTDAYRKAVMAIVVTWGELLDKNVSKAWDEATQATERLIRAQERLARTRAEADQVQAGISFDQQERAIIQFADLAIGATENMNRELLDLEIQRRDSALAIQQDEIDRLTKKRDDYQQKLLTMEEAPGLFSEAEVIATRAHLDEANAELEAGLSTRDQIAEQHNARYFAIEESMLRRAGQSWRGYFELIASGERRAGLLLQLFGKNVAQGIGEAVKAAVMGSATFSEAMAQMGKAALAELAGMAVVEALKEGAKAARDIAEGFSMLANPFTAALAPGFFLAGAKHLGVAALWGALGAGAAVGGSAIGGKEGGGTAGGGTVTPFQSPQQVEQQPVQTQNVFRLGSGALISKRTVTMLGDDVGGGDAREAVVPLDNPRVMQDIAEAFARAGGGGTTIHIKVEGMISTDNMHQFITQLNRDVNSGKYRVTASNSRRLTKGSL